MVGAAILVLLFIDTVITAFLLGKYRSVLKEVRALSTGTAPQTQKGLDPADIQAAMSILTGGKDA